MDIRIDGFVPNYGLQWTTVIVSRMRRIRPSQFTIEVGNRPEHKVNGAVGVTVVLVEQSHG